MLPREIRALPPSPVPADFLDTCTTLSAAIEELAPDVLADLASLAVSPAYAAADLRAALEAWSKRWNLDAAWCRETAMETLHEWEMPWEGERKRAWCPRSGAWA